MILLGRGPTKAWDDSDVNEGEVIKQWVPQSAEDPLELSAIRRDKRMIIAVVSIVMWFSLGTPALTCQSSPASRLVTTNENGWQVPGHQSTLKRKPDSVNVAEIGGRPVHVAYFENLPIWNKRQRRYLSSPITFPHVEADRVLLKTENLVASKVWRYSASGRVFLYVLWAAQLVPTDLHMEVARKWRPRIPDWAVR
jgi:hypothetical protein